MPRVVIFLASFLVFFLPLVGGAPSLHMSKVPSVQTDFVAGEEVSPDVQQKGVPLRRLVRGLRRYRLWLLMRPGIKCVDIDESGLVAYSTRPLGVPALDQRNASPCSLLCRARDISAPHRNVALLSEPTGRWNGAMSVQNNTKK